jgi:hypothetical protein
MSFTYDTSISSDIDKFRLRLRDTNYLSYEFEDEEITGLVSMFGSVTRALIQACYILHSKYTTSSQDEIKIDDITIKDSASSKAKQYLSLAKQLEDALLSGFDTEYPIISFGGVYQSEVEDNYELQLDDTIVDNPFPQNVFDTFNSNMEN